MYRLTKVVTIKDMLSDVGFAPELAANNVDTMATNEEETEESDSEEVESDF